MTRPFDRGGERVAEERVVKHWLAIEREKAGRDAAGVDGLSGREALDELLERKPGAAAFLWRAQPIEWSRVALSTPEFDRLRVIGGPDGLSWRALSPDGTIARAAARIDRGEPAALAAATGVDVDRVLDLAAAVAEGTELAALVLTKRRGGDPPRVADGNHRATALALHRLRTDEYRPQRAYLGVGANPVVEPLRQRLRGVLARFQPSGPRW